MNDKFIDINWNGSLNLIINLYEFLIFIFYFIIFIIIFVWKIKENLEGESFIKMIGILK